MKVDKKKFDKLLKILVENKIIDENDVIRIYEG